MSLPAQGFGRALLLENGNIVFGVEPNADMRQAGERLLADFPKFTSLAGSAEATTLPDASVDFVSCSAGGALVRSAADAAGVCEDTKAGRMAGVVVERTGDRYNSVSAGL